MNRREFNRILSATLGTTLPLVSIATEDLGELGLTRKMAHHAVYDGRLAFTSKDIKTLLGEVDKLYTYNGDVTAIWYLSLDSLWSAGKIITSGITRHSELFILRTLAAERNQIVSRMEPFNDHVVWLMEPAAQN